MNPNRPNSAILLEFISSYNNWPYKLWNASEGKSCKVNKFFFMSHEETRPWIASGSVEVNP